MGNFIFDDDESLGGGNIRPIWSSEPPPPVVLPVSLELSSSSDDVEVGDTVNFSVVITYSDTTTSSDLSLVSLSSSDESVMTINESGVAEAIAVGNATISAQLISDSSITDSVSVHVEAIPVSIELSPRPEAATVGDTFSFSVVITYSDETTSSDLSLVSMSSTDTSIMTIDETGTAVAISAGDVSIHAELKPDTSIFDNVDLTVSAVPEDLNKFSIVVDGVVKNANE